MSQTSTLTADASRYMKEPFRCREILAQLHMRPHNRQIGGKNPILDTITRCAWDARHGAVCCHRFRNTGRTCGHRIPECPERAARKGSTFPRSESSTWSFVQARQNRLVWIRERFGEPDRQLPLCVKEERL